MLPKSLEKFLIALKPLENSIHAIILFGSYSNGTSNKYSDIDLLIILKEKNKQIHEEIILITERAMADTGYNELLSPHIIDLKHYEKMKDFKTDFFQVIAEEGKILWKAA